MANKNNKGLIKIYGVTIADEKCRTRAYGHGATKIDIDGKEIYVQYVDYFIDDLIDLIKQQNLEKEIIKRIEVK